MYGKVYDSKDKYFFKQKIDFHKIINAFYKKNNHKAQNINSGPRIKCITKCYLKGSI